MVSGFIDSIEHTKDNFDIPISMLIFLYGMEVNKTNEGQIENGCDWWVIFSSYEFQLYLRSLD